MWSLGHRNHEKGNSPMHGLVKGDPQVDLWGGEKVGTQMDYLVGVP
jgi:hypothetical protein